jgi:hypothetical protein
MDLKRHFLFDILPKNSICAEVGVWKGDFSQEILDHLNPKELYLIDPWLYIPSYSESWYGGAEAKSQEDMDKIYFNVIERFKNNSRVEILKMSSTEASKIFPDNYFDFVYIDSCHLYEYIRQDLNVWYPKIKLGRILAGDDYGTEGWWNNGPQIAVDEFVKENKLELFVKNNQFIIRKEK